MRTIFRCSILFTILLCFFYPCWSQNCSAPLNGGSLSTSNTSVCPGIFFGITVNGSSTGAGLTYQWQSSPDNSNWTDMPGFTNIGMSTKQSLPTWYRRKIMCNSGGEAYSNSIQITVRDFNTCYCTPSTSNCASGFSITNVTYGSINNNSACGINGYSNYTGSVAPANIPQGSWLPISVTVATGSVSRFVRCFIDVNQSGSFEEREGTMLAFPTGNVYTGYLKLPFTAKPGLTRMRVLFNTSNTNPCYPEFSSETEDYLINITPASTSAQGHVIYVKQTATGSDNSGRSWANAKTSFRGAIAIATPGDTIKVAKGIYYGGTSQTNGTVLIDSISILGGYPDNGTPGDAQRNAATQPTILSGYVSSTNTATDYHVLYASGTMNNCIVDGFIIQNGGNYFNGSPAQLRGGGISIEGGANVIVLNCVFRNHNVPINGGMAIAVNNSRPVFQNCFVVNNGGTYTASNILVENGSSVQFINTIVAKNTCNLLMHVDSSKVFWKNSTIGNNIFDESIIRAARKSEVNFSNSITYFNGIRVASWQTISYDSAEVKLEGGSTASFKSSLAQVYTGGTNMIAGIQPKFKDTSSVTGADGFYFSGDDGFSLNNPCSPAINAGSNTEAGGITTDIVLQPRLFGSAVDMGAYEVQASLATMPKVIYVKNTASGANDGSSWANAFTDLHKALAACSDTIKIAAGTYTPWKTTAARPYLLENKRIIWGAYPATGNPGNGDRNYALHQTLISGETNTTERADIVARGQQLDSTAIIDGISFTNVGRYSPAMEYGALIYTYCNNPIISNCRFTGNYRRVFLGRKNQNPQFFNCEFYNNNPASSYALDLVVLSNSQKTTMKNCSFRNNSLLTYTGIVGEHGKIVVISNTDAIIDSCTFERNFATVLYLGRSNAQISNSHFLQNYAKENQTDLRLEYSNPTFKKCLFVDSAWGYFRSYEGGIMYNYFSNPTFNDCQFYDGRVDGKGGVAFNESSKPKFGNCVFVNNINAFYNQNGSDIELTNCVATGGSSAIYSSDGSFMQNVQSNPVITNCVVTNSKTDAGGVISNDGFSSPKIYNSVFWRNFQQSAFDDGSLNSRTDIKNNGAALPVIKNSMLEFYDAGAGNNNTKGIDPRLKNYENAIGPDNIWFTADDGLRLCDCSPALNSGDNSLITATTDIAGQARIFSTAIDLGAYELQTVPALTSKTSFVNAAATGANTGVSWADAFNDFHSALGNACADTIKMAAGIYKPARTHRDSVFYVNRNLVILGSYAAPTDVRDVDATPTILSGDLGLPSDTVDNSNGIMKAYYIDTLVLDGLVLKDANRTSNTSTQNEHALSAGYIRLLSIYNSRLVNNNAGNSTGGAIYLYHIRNSQIKRTVFSGNRATWGAGIYFTANGPSKILDCVFEKNVSSWQGGGAFVGYGGVSFINTLFTQNSAVQGGGLLFDNNVEGLVTNCTFANNVILPWSGGSYGGGIYCTASAWQGGGLGPYISNCIFTGNAYNAQMGQGTFGDIYYPKNGYHPHTSQVELRIHHSAVSTNPYNYWGGGLIGPSFIRYKNGSNPIGPDGKWFTGDDGLQLSPCSGGVDAGANARVTEAKDMSGNNRIINTTVDMGPYEFNGMPIFSGLLNAAADSIIANKELTDTAGWTHYYRDCRYLLSIKKNGKTIGTVGDGTFEVKVVNGANYNTGQGMNLTTAAYNTSGLPWIVMNRYWNVKSNATISDSILIRFPYTKADYNDVESSNPTIAAHSQLEFFKVSGTNYPFDLNVSPSNFTKYANALQPSLSKWFYSQQDSVHLCDYYIKSFSGGGGGTVLFGPLSDVVINTASLSASAATPNNILTATVIEKNIGVGAATTHKVVVYLSADNQLTPGQNGDVAIGQQTISGSLAAGSLTDTLRFQLAIPCNTTPGNYTMLVAADGDNVLAETNEQNNLLNLPFTVNAGSPLPPTPVITATPAATICAPGNVVLNASSTGCNNCNFTWSTGQTGSSITVYSSGTYTYTATNACGSSTASETVSILPQPDFSVSIPSYLCQNTSRLLTASGAVSYTWSGPGLVDTTGSSVTVIPPAPGTAIYTVKATGANGCSRTYNYQVTIYAAPVVNIALTDITICAGSSATLQATSSGAETNVWSPVTGLNTQYGTTVIATPAATTNYYLTGTSIMGCKTVDSVMVNVAPSGNCTPMPDLNINSHTISPSTITKGGTVTASFIEINNGSVAAGQHKVYFYLSADQTLTPGTNGDVLLDNYALTGLSANNNTGTLNKNLIIPCTVAAGSYYVFAVADGALEVTEMSETNNHLAALQLLSVQAITVTTSASATQVCSGSAVTLTASSAGATSFSWSGPGLNNTNGNTVTATPVSAGILTYTVTATANGCSQTATVQVTSLAAPTINVTPGDTAICTGNSVTLTASGATTYVWSPSTGLNTTSGATVTASPSVTTTYTVISTASGCSATKSRTVTILQPVTPSVSISYSGCGTSSLTFTATGVNGGSSPQYQWYVNNNLSGTGAAVNLTGISNGTQVYAKLTSNAACAAPQMVNSAITTVNCVGTGISNIDALETFSVSPNPSPGRFVVQLKLNQNKKVSFEVKDVSGKSVFAAAPVYIFGRLSKTIDLRGMSQGAYYLTIRIGDSFLTYKLVIVR